MWGITYKDFLDQAREEYSFSDHMREWGYECNQELDAWASYEEAVVEIAKEMWEEYREVSQ